MCLLLYAIYDIGEKLKQMFYIYIYIYGEFAIKWELKFNGKKSKVMMIEKNHGEQRWKICREEIEDRIDFKYLGVWLIGR